MGESLAILIYFAKYCAYRKKNKQMTGPCPPGKKPYKNIPHIFTVATPMFFDMTQTLLYNMALFYILSSIHAMMKNLSLVFTAIISFILFRRYR